MFYHCFHTVNYEEHPVHCAGILTGFLYYSSPGEEASRKLWKHKVGESMKQDSMDSCSRKAVIALVPFLLSYYNIKNAIFSIHVTQTVGFKILALTFICRRGLINYN